MGENFGKIWVKNELIQKIAEATGDLIDNKVADRITKVSKIL